ncbi:hypothetical protein C1645_765648 [Glomus cerebriforme]|uniref:Uncharacterized protein n=1 Tax=Glomus cerebriforme TaxID=658196 RepID=A0A397T1L1_9GLOM|nr:hypothetical protein C1645_765648 [Glomus cerebriforme]
MIQIKLYAVLHYFFLEKKIQCTIHNNSYYLFHIVLEYIILQYIVKIVFARMLFSDIKN